jgi:hypothetical protein
VRPRILILVLCGTERCGWVNPLLFEALLALQLADKGYSLAIDTLFSFDRVEVARNRGVQYARDTGADFLVMVDNDMVLPKDFAGALEQIVSSGKPVVSFPSARAFVGGEVELLTPQDNGVVEGDFQQTGQAGSGVMVISSEVWRKIPRGPWFRWPTNDDELLSRQFSEDIYFCGLVQQHGLTVWVHRSIAGHLKTSDITSLRMIDRRPS